MSNLFSNWNFMRVVRLALGVFIIVQGIQTLNWMFIILGSLFTIMPLMNIGCCSTQGCSASVSKTNKKIEDIHYEEVN